MLTYAAPKDLQYRLFRPVIGEARLSADRFQILAPGRATDETSLRFRQCSWAEWARLLPGAYSLAGKSSKGPSDGGVQHRAITQPFHTSTLGDDSFVDGVDLGDQLADDLCIVFKVTH